MVENRLSLKHLPSKLNAIERFTIVSLPPMCMENVGLGEDNSIQNQSLEDWKPYLIEAEARFKPKISCWV